MACRCIRTDADRGATVAPPSRHAGSDRIATAGEHPVPDREWPDALVATPAAMAWSAPLLLVRPSALPPATDAAIRDLAPQRAVVLGGHATIDQTVEAELRARVPAVDRIAGTDRYATAVAVADEIVTPPGVVVVATGQRFPDALAAGPAAVAWGGVVVLTPSYPVAPVTLHALQAWRADLTAA